MKLTTSLVSLLLIATLGCTAQTPITVGALNPDGSFTITATVSELNTCFDHYSILDDYDGVDFVIVQDTITSLYFLETTGIGSGPNLGTTIAMRVGLGLGGGIFTWDSGGNLGAESCNGNPCESCKFAVGGGCECRRNDGGAGGHCDHSISK